MALQGSLSDFALPDVLSLLSSTRKSGELHVEGAGRDGRVWLDGGLIVSAAVGDATDPVDALFALLRQEHGSFRFDRDRRAAHPAAGREVAPVLEEATARLTEWKLVEAVVPSLETRVGLAAEAPTSPVVVQAEQWKVLVAIANGGTVASVAHDLQLGEFGACRMVKELVDGGLVVVQAAAGPESPTEADTDAVASGDRRREPDAPVADVDLDSLVEIPNRRRRASRAESVFAALSADADVESPLDAELSPTKRLSAAAARKAEEAAASSNVSGGPVEADTFARRMSGLSTRDDRKPVEATEPADDSEATVPAEPVGSVATPAGLGSVTPEEAAAIKDAGLVDENGEPINRSLLLKFLSSVRS